MKKKGFTLIELLAVIVILAIIALILVPIVSDIIESARKTSFRESVNGIIDSTNNYLHDYILKYNNELNDYPVVFTCDGTSCKTTDNDVLTFKGNVPKSGNIIIQRDGVLAEYITDGKYCTYGYKWNLVIEDNCGEVDVTNPTITGTQNGKNITLTMTDNESGVDSYCVTNVADPSGCSWVSVTGNSVNYEIAEAGTWYFFAKDKKGNISDSINFTTTSADYCQLSSNTIVYDSGTIGTDTYTISSGCTGTYKLEVWGAQGGNSGGKGGYSSGNIVLTSSDILTINIGVNSNNTGEARSSWNRNDAGGNNHTGSGYVGAGGPGTSMLLGDTVVIVAGGGGGRATASENRDGSSAGAGGVGGGLTGGAGAGGAQGGTQDADGTRTNNNGGGYSVVFGGAGGGYHKGANGILSNGYIVAGGGAGGSGYIGGVTDGQTIAGDASMPTHDGTSTMTGNAGNGYAKITFISLN
nr:prepilin-type N-terminal cleavage/methylation domain-containing protein [Bacilli bacterium]